MKKVIRLTESDLARIVRRVIAEDVAAAAATSTNPWSLLKTPTPANIAKVIFDAKGLFNDDEKIVIAALSKIKDKSMWWQVTKELQKLTGGKGIAEYINTFMQGTDFNRVEYNSKDLMDELERIFGFSYIGMGDKYPYNKLNFEESVIQGFQTGYSSI
jgi:hypothetical protein